MPTYEYECEACGHQMAEFQRMSDPPLATCPKCGGRLQRLVSGGAGVLFKGSGSGAANPSCDRTTPCCGRTTPCDERPCE